MNFTAEWDSISTHCVGSDMSATCRSQNRRDREPPLTAIANQLVRSKLQSMEMTLIRRHVTKLGVCGSRGDGSGWMLSPRSSHQMVERCLIAATKRPASAVRFRPWPPLEHRAKCKAELNSLLLTLHRGQNFLIRSSRKSNGM